MSSELTTNNSNIYKENIITTPYEKVLTIINDAIRYISMTSKTQGKLIKELSWVIKVITSHSLYTYELKDNDAIEKYSHENPDFKQFVDFVNAYNEDVIQMNKKTNIINSKTLKMSNQLNIPSFKLKKKQFLFNSNTNLSYMLRNKEQIKNDNLTYSYSPNDIIKNSKNLQLNSLREVLKNSKSPNPISLPSENNTTYTTLKNQYKRKPHIKSMDLTKKGKVMKLELFSKSINLVSNNNINYNNQYHSNKNLKELVIMPDIIYNNNSEIKAKTEKGKKKFPRISTISYPIQTIENTFINIKKIINENNYDPKQILSKDFNIFQLKNLIGYENVLPLMGKTILEAFGLTNPKIIQTNKLDSFLYTICNQYNEKVLYHNALHGADVTQTLSLIFLNSKAEKICDTNVLDILSIFIAALGHDLGHPGYNNNFQINASTDMAITYNDNSCLENYHASKLFRILKKEENDILEKLNIDERKLIRKRMISEILSTDMAVHVKVISIIKAKIPGQIFDEEKKFELFSQNPNNKFQEQQELLDFFVHASDLAHNAKKFSISIQWVELLSNEFWIQGDKEKSMNLPISFLCDRERYDIPTSQVGFIKGFIIPTFDILVTIFPSLNFLMDNAKVNLGNWEELIGHQRTGWNRRVSIRHKSIRKDIHLSKFSQRKSTIKGENNKDNNKDSSNIDNNNNNNTIDKSRRNKDNIQPLQVIVSPRNSIV